MSPKQAGARLLVTLKTTQWASLVVQRSPANAGDTGSIPGLRRSQMWRSDEARASQLMSLCSRACKSQLRSPRAATAHVQCPGSVLPERSHCREKPKNPQPESRPHTPQPEKSPYTKESEDPPQPKMIKNKQTDRPTDKTRRIRGIPCKCAGKLFTRGTAVHTKPFSYHGAGAHLLKLRASVLSVNTCNFCQFPPVRLF